MDLLFEGMMFAIMPSILFVAWTVWRSTSNIDATAMAPPPRKVHPKLPYAGRSQLLRGRQLRRVLGPTVFVGTLGLMAKRKEGWEKGQGKASQPAKSTNSRVPTPESITDASGRPGTDLLKVIYDDYNDKPTYSGHRKGFS